MKSYLFDFIKQDVCDATLLELFLFINIYHYCKYIDHGNMEGSNCVQSHLRLTILK